MTVTPQEGAIISGASAGALLGAQLAAANVARRYPNNAFGRAYSQYWPVARALGPRKVGPLFLSQRKKRSKSRSRSKHKKGKKRRSRR